MDQAWSLGRAGTTGDLCSNAVRDNRQQAGKGSTPASLGDLGQGIPKLYLPQVQHGIILVLLLRAAERIICSKIWSLTLSTVTFFLTH